MDNKKKTKQMNPFISLKDVSNSMSPLHIAEFDDEDSKFVDKEQELESKELEDFYKRDRKKYIVEIDWTQFDELQIQLLISILFHNLGYTVENWHEADPAREDGADLILKKAKESIAIAVKIKPKAPDRSQLIDLYKRKEKQKVYVYVQTPAGKFHESMTEYKDRIDFWDSNKLSDVFLANNVGFASSIIFDSHELSRTIDKTRRVLFGLRNKCRKLNKVKTEKLNWQSLRFLWRLKDIGVTLNKSNESIITLLEKPFNMKSKKVNEHFIKIFLVYLDVLNDKLNSYLRYFSEFYEENKDLVHNSIISEIDRSHWLHLQQYRTDYNTLENLQKELKDEIGYKKIEEKQKANEKYEKYLSTIVKNNDVWEVMQSRVRNLMIFGAGTEEIIDDIYSEFIEQYVSPDA